MATTIALAASDEEMADESRPRVSLGFACFSFAAYAKYLVAHLRASGVPVAPGLSEAEFAAVESTYAFTFSPDLRNVLREGLPVGPGFPNWRSASPQQLRLLLGLPADALLREIVVGGIWPRAWGPRPRDRAVAEAVAKEELLKAPRLVPVYRNFYLPSTPCLPGNPVFYVRGSDVRPAGLDLSDFFRRGYPRGWAAGAPVPAWAATSARKVELWTQLAEEGAWVELQRVNSPRKSLVDRWLEEARRRLREGGWSETEVREMAGDDDGDDPWDFCPAKTSVFRVQGEMSRQLGLLSLAMLRGGWSADDVVESMGWRTRTKQ
ncbi:uncharacterized protein LOC141824405 [Curcuma longa]|uniref:uncharacterized protein LOC141824405 n=1 Tax=Curcuma longa TaxID=136217 RepID=UPI003D9F5B24